MKLIKIDEQWLKTQYIDKNRSTKDISEELKCNIKTIKKRCSKLGLKKTTKHWEKNKLVVGQKFNSLTIVSESLFKKNNTYYQCQCDCGNMRLYRKYDILNRYKSCGCLLKNKTYQEISGTYWKSIKNAAKQRNFKFDITAEYVWNLFLRQERKCALSGKTLYFTNRTNQSDQTASLDRINSDIGYIVGNVQWVHKDINKMKGVLTDSYFLELCKQCYLNTNKPIDQAKQEKWDRWFLGLAQYISTASKDKSTKVGCVIVDSKKRVVSVGYNGFPYNIEDDTSLLDNREEKLKRIIHAEPNAIIFAKQDLTGCQLFTYPFAPCSNCCSLILQSGITRIVAPKASDSLKARWGDSLKVSESMIKEAGIEFIEYDMEPK